MTSLCVPFSLGTLPKCRWIYHLLIVRVRAEHQLCFCTLKKLIWWKNWSLKELRRNRSVNYFLKLMNNSSSLIILRFLLRFGFDWEIKINKTLKTVFMHISNPSSSSKYSFARRIFNSLLVVCVLIYPLNVSTILHLFFLQMASSSSGLVVNTLKIFLYISVTPRFYVFDLFFIRWSCMSLLWQMLALVKSAQRENWSTRLWYRYVTWAKRLSR